ncbi:MAG: hypothetical protein ACRDV0_02240 [Acidimicrobiales bacterium]
MADAVDAEPISDEELCALALAADPDAPLAPDAVAWDGAVLHQRGLLPDWYMPTPAPTGRSGLSRALVIALVVGFVAINALGLCITSGFISIA